MSPQVFHNLQFSLSWQCLFGECCVLEQPQEPRGHPKWLCLCLPATVSSSLPSLHSQPPWHLLSGLVRADGWGNQGPVTDIRQPGWAGRVTMGEAAWGYWVDIHWTVWPDSVMPLTFWSAEQGLWTVVAKIPLWKPKAQSHCLCTQFLTPLGVGKMEISAHSWVLLAVRIKVLGLHFPAIRSSVSFKRLRAKEARDFFWSLLLSGLSEGLTN
jgi:hypothetical protein